MFKRQQKKYSLHHLALLAADALLALLGRNRKAASQVEEQAATRRLDEAIEAIDQGFALFDAEDRLTRCNSRFREMHPLSAPFTPGTPFETLIRRSASRGGFADCNPQNAEQWVAERLRAHRAAAKPIELRMNDGRWLRVDERRTADGGNVGLSADISVLKRRETELAAKTAVLEATLAAMIQGVTVWDADRRLAAFNRQVQILLELPDGLLRVGLSLDAFLTHLAERGEFGPGDAKTLMQERRDQALNPDGDRRERRRPNGAMLEVRSTPARGGLILTTYADVTERRAAEERLRESEERFRKLSDSAMEGILAHADGVIVDANRAAGELLRLPAENMIGRPLTDFVAPEMHPAIKDHLAHRQESRIELPCLRADGRRILVEAQNRHVQHRGRWVSMASFRDVTEQRDAETRLRRAKEEAEQASRQKNDFVRTISHELRTPMNGVLGMLELLQDAGLPDPLRGFAATAYVSAEAMLGLLNDLLDLSKIEADRLTLDVADFNAAETVMSAAEVVAARAAAKGLSLAVCVAADVDCRMRGDAARLRQILLNLVGNAVKFTERGGVSICVEADFLNDPGIGESADPKGLRALRFEVRDSGAGIAPEALGKLFGEFVQVHDGSARGVGGTGLGLAISKRLVELMGGRIGVNSARGEGSRFWFVVPTDAPPTEPDDSIAPSLDGAVAVAIDAAAVSRAALTRQLAGWGADVAACPDMETAAAALGAAAAARLPGLLAGIGVPTAGPPPKGAAVAVVAVDQTVRCVVLRPMGASIPPLHADTTALDWPACPAALLAALTGGRPAAERHFSAVAAPRPFAGFRAEGGGPAGGGPAGKGFAAAGAFPAGRVLLAEDGDTNRLVATAFLEREGYEVIHAADGREAVEAAEGMTFDLILMDIGMPVMDGLEATRRIRALPPPSGNIPIVALTADASADDRRRCLDAGMNDHLSKPLERGQLSAAVARWAPPHESGSGGANDRRFAGGLGNGFAGGSGAAAPLKEILDCATLAQLECDLDRDMLEGLIRQFLDEATGRVERLSAPDADVAALRREAHTLKSTSGTFGALRLCAAARALEAACRAEDGGDTALAPSLAPPSRRALIAPLPELLREAADAYRQAGWLG